LGSLEGSKLIFKIKFTYTDTVACSAFIEADTKEDAEDVVDENLSHLEDFELLSMEETNEQPSTKMVNKGPLN
jgi:hypothetical protein